MPIRCQPVRWQSRRCHRVEVLACAVREPAARARQRSRCRAIGSDETDPPPGTDSWRPGFNLISRRRRTDCHYEDECGRKAGKQANDSLQQPWSRPAVGSFYHGRRGTGVGRGLGVAFGRAVGVGLAVAVGVTLGAVVAVGVTVGVTLGVTVAVEVAVGVGVGVNVGDAVGVGEGDPTAERISTRPQPTTLFGGPGVPHCL